MLNLNWGKIHSIIFFVTLSWLEKFFPYSYTSPCIHSWIVETLWVIIFWVLRFWATPPHPYMTNLTLPHTPSWPTPPHPFITHPPHPTLSWPTHPTPPLVHFWAQRSLFFMGCFTMSSHPYMTQPHPTPPLSWPTHPTPPLVNFWAQRSLLLHYVSLR